MRLKKIITILLFSTIFFSVIHQYPIDIKIQSFGPSSHGDGTL
ncbi:hypothetical protein SAMN03159332_5228 [Paenibacillus sp. 276b]|nr:hypothetical protein SAMN03159332_5228 [Paenibacillus sp. 276b]